MVVSIAVFPFALVLGLIAPTLIKVEVPFDLFITKTVISETAETSEEHADGSSSIVSQSIERENVLGLFEYYYEVETTKQSASVETSRSMIDPNTKLQIEKTTSDDIEFYVIFLYWILLESSIWQASIGKRIMGLKVVTADGGKPDVFHCAARNLLKILSGAIFMIGFMMAGWTAKKQGLHDMLPRMLVVKSDSMPSAQQDS